MVVARSNCSRIAVVTIAYGIDERKTAQCAYTLLQKLVASCDGCRDYKTRLEELSRQHIIHPSLGSEYNTGGDSGRYTANTDGMNQLQHTTAVAMSGAYKIYYRLVSTSLHCALAAAQCIVIGPVCLCVCGWVCYHDNSKLRASIFTKLGL